MMPSSKTTLRSFASAIILTSVLSFTGTAQAQTQLQQQTIIADPSRAGDRLSESLAIPQSGPKIRVNKVALQNAPAGADNVKFNFGGIEVTGASTYSADDFYGLYKDKIGKEISLTDLYAIANDMTLKYRNDGYVLTRVVVPVQTIQGGIPKLQVVEGFIDQITIQGGEEDTATLERIQEFAQQINDKTGPLNIADLERQLLLINDLPGITARSVIDESRSKAGAADMMIIVGRDTFQGVVGIDNHGSRFLGPVQLSGAAIFNSALGWNEQITAQVVAAPDSGFELGFFALRYEQPINRYGTKLNFGGSFTDTDPGYTLSQFQVEGISKNLYFGVEHPVIRTRNANLFARGLFDWRNVDSSNNVEATRKDRIRALRAGLRADFLDNLLGNILGVAVNSVDFEFSHGVDVFNGSDEGDQNLTRTFGDPTFAKGTLRLERLQRVSNNINVLLEGRGQLSNNPLLSSEEFGLGGYGSVRGFDPSQVVGDDGISGKVEVQWTPQQVKNTELFTFVDSGTVWDKDATTSANKRNSLTSVGFGVRLDLPMDINAEFVASQPLHRDVSTQDERDPQFYFSVNKSF